MAARSAAGVIGADAAIDVAGIEGNVGALGEPGLLGRTEATSKASGAGVGALWAKAEEAARMQTESLNPNEGMLYLCSILLFVVSTSAMIQGNSPLGLYSPRPAFSHPLGSTQ